ncbi:MAG: DUF853 domain-containing protein, partial [gamma proteobacterium symbiont of Lucinoma myriamae]|nr:DUF853 domain-containing protein [gamma proteobacterium symbiont of Lucinoma myriamae]MCU7817323.1 DUF853 domain-containing protein [gamma proteobacterium symbiont of Lucinoma myriamae]MCU7831774.1 DUF853 domain-containing protein [gamma proteobacterium symbiont of Lucinoma myriamae]
MSINFLIGGNDKTQVNFSAKTANRHGMIAGATGTGKTVTLQILAENFSKIGVPVFLADIKGDLSGLAASGAMNEKIQSRIDTIKIENYSNHANPSLFWDLYAENGHPVHPKKRSSPCNDIISSTKLLIIELFFSRLE